MASIGDFFLLVLVCHWQPFYYTAVLLHYLAHMCVRCSNGWNSLTKILELAFMLETFIFQYHVFGDSFIPVRSKRCVTPTGNGRTPSFGPFYPTVHHAWHYNFLPTSFFPRAFLLSLKKKDLFLLQLDELNSVYYIIKNDHTVIFSECGCCKSACGTLSSLDLGVVSVNKVTSSRWFAWAHQTCELII